MTWLWSPGDWLGRLLFQRGLALVYVLAFVAAARQGPALLGERGLLPVPQFVRGRRFRDLPSLFTVRYSDRLWVTVSWLGAALAAAALIGVIDAGPIGVSMLGWFVLWALYLSIVNVGQQWYGFGWESLLLETGFLAIFLGPRSMAPPWLVLLLLRWLLFRVEFGAGLIKIRGDQCWRDLTCLRYHHETQPMPNPLSWYFHHLPMSLHRIEVGANHVTQLAVPFLLFLPQPIAGIGASVMVITQCWLLLSGNFAWLNTVTIVVGLSVVGGPVVGPLLGVDPPALVHDGPGWFAAILVAVAAVIAVLSRRPARNLVSRRQLMNASFDKLHLVNTYGAFGSITKVRHEIIVEGRLGSEWRPYEFKGKPGDVNRRPPQVAPYHLRLDWLLWFAALSPGYAERWWPTFVTRLLENDEPTLRLLRTNPFPDRPPEEIRARFFRYRYTTPAERKATGGAWWHRDLVGEFMAPVSRAAEASRPRR
ncbi:MAG: lipase maturation factor family protein [Acidobacteria bacterium]|nr:lipase maturation factor family protein [Acidobacteriota bacterium]